MAQDMRPSASLYFHNCGVVLIQSAVEDKKHQNMHRVWKTWPQTCCGGGRFSKVNALLFLRGEVPNGSRGHWVTSPGNISSRGHRHPGANMADFKKAQWQHSMQNRCLHVLIPVQRSLWLKVYLKAKREEGTQLPMAVDTESWPFQFLLWVLFLVNFINHDDASSITLAMSCEVMP